MAVGHQKLFPMPLKCVAVEGSVPKQMWELLLCANCRQLMCEIYGRPERTTEGGRVQLGISESKVGRFNDNQVNANT